MSTSRPLSRFQNRFCEPAKDISCAIMSSETSVERKATSPANSHTKYILGTNRGPLSTTSADVDSEGDDNLLEKSPPAKTTRTQRLRRHCARFWCCYLLFSVIFLAIFLPVFFLVIIPAIAQLVVNNSDLVLVSASVLQPRTDSILLSLEAAIDLPIAFPVRIEPITLDLFNRDLSGNTTWAKAYINGTTIHGNTTLARENKPTPVNPEQWNQYVHQFVFEPHAPLSVRGSTNAYLGILKSHVTLDKDIHQTTLNAFAGFTITDPQLLLSARDDGTNLIANATLPNPSVLTLEIGTTVLDLRSGDYLLGNCTLDHLYLRPGNHSTPIRATIDLPLLLNHLQEILGSQGGGSSSLLSGYLTLNAIGRSVFYEGVEVPYYTNAMRDLNLTAQVPLGPLILNTLREVVNPNGTNLLHNLTDPNGPTNIQDILQGIDDPDGSLGLDNITAT